MMDAIHRGLRTLAVLSLLVVAACGRSDPPVNYSASAWQLNDVSIAFGPNISRTATGDDYSSTFVWNGYNGGNRKQQVIALFRSAVQEVAETTMTGTTPVRVAVTVNYFHALTDASRLWCCGVHRIYADVSVLDATSGAVLAEGKDVSLGRLALGGLPGLVAVASGRDQPVRVREGIARRFREWVLQH